MGSTPGGSLIDGAAGSNTASGNAVGAHHLRSRQPSSLPTARRSARSTPNPYRARPPTRLDTEASGSCEKKRKALTEEEEAPCGISGSGKVNNSAPLTPRDPNRTYSSKDDGAKRQLSDHAMDGNTWSSPTKRKCLPMRNYLSQFKPSRKGEATAVVARSEQSSIPTKTKKVKESPFQKLQRLPDGCHPDFDNDHLCSVNKLREFWHKSRGAVFVDDKEHVMKTILFILSVLPDACRPFLLVTSASLPSWEDKFSRFAPCINVVVYAGEKDVHKLIQNPEFHDNGRHTMLHVLLAHPDAILEDIKNVECIGWEAVIVDYCQNSVLKHLKQLKQLSTDFRMVLLSSPLKNNLVEYKNLLAFLNSEQEDDGDYIDADALAMLRARFTRHIAYERKTGSSNFLEYWVPAYLSQVQLETYCSILLENSSVLLSPMTTDNAEALRDTVVRLWKCCNHPCLVGLRHSPINARDVTESEDDIMHNSGKLLLLERMLKEIRNKRLRAIVLFQSDGAVGDRMGNILEELVRHRFGPESCERVQNRSAFSGKQEAMNMFNDTTKGRFVFLIDSRACHSSIKLLSVDAIIIYGSDLNPLNDLKALRKIKIESQLKYVRIFRLYTPFTVEEKGLVLAKQSMIIDNNGQDIIPSLSHCLLSWGVSFLFSRLDELQQDNCASKSYESSTVFMDKVVLELLAELSTDAEDSGKLNSATISKACMSGEFYSRNITLIGEREGVSSLDGDPPKFWLNLLDRESRCQDYKRTRVPIEETNEARRKLRKTGEIAVPSSEFSSDMINDDLFPEISTPSSAELHLLPETGVENASTPKSLRAELKRELSKLIKVLKLPDDVRIVAKQFLEYLLKNHLVVREPQGIQHAFNIALCWCAASLRQYTKLDHKKSLALAADCLNYEYNENLTGFFYKKLGKEKFLHKLGGRRNTMQNDRLSPHESSSANLRSDHIFPKQAVGLHGNVTNGTQESRSTSDQMVSDGQELVSAPETGRECHLSSEELHIVPKQAVDLHGNFTNDTQESQSAADQMVSDGQELVSAPEADRECHLSSEEPHIFPKQAVDLHGNITNGTQERQSAAGQMVSDGQELVSAPEADRECHLSSEGPHIFPKQAVDLHGNITNGTQDSRSVADQMVLDGQELLSAPEANKECHLSSKDPHIFPKQAVDLHGNFTNDTQESQSAADQMISDRQESVSAPEADSECHLSSEEPHVFPKQAVDLHGNFTNGTQERWPAAHQMVSDGQELVAASEADIECHLSGEEPPGCSIMKRIELFNVIFSLREKTIIEKQQHEILILRTQRNAEVRKLKEVCHAVVQHIGISDIDEESRSDQIKLVIKWFTLLMYAFLVHMRHQLAKLEELQSTTQVKEQLMKEKLKQKILSGQLDPFLDLCDTLPDSDFVIEEFIHFGRHNGDNHVDNTLSLGCDQFLGDRLVGITLPRNPVPSEAFSACPVRNEPTEAQMRSGGGATLESVDLPDGNIHWSSDGTGSCSASASPSSHDSINLESSTGEPRSIEHAKTNNIASPSMLPGSVTSLVMGINADNDVTVAADPDHLESLVLACPQNLMTLQHQPAEAEPSDPLLAMAAQDLQTEMQTSCPALDAQHQRMCPDDSSKMNLELDMTAETLQKGTSSDNLGDSSTGVKDKNVDAVAADPLNSENHSYVAPQNPDAGEVGTQTDQSSMPAQHSISLPAKQNTAISRHPPAEAEPSGNLDMEADRSLQLDIQPPSSMMNSDSSQIGCQLETTPVLSQGASTYHHLVDGSMGFGVDNNGTVCAHQARSESPIFAAPQSPDVLPFSSAIGTHANVSSTSSLQSSDSPSMPPPALAQSPGMLGTQVEQDLHPDIIPSTLLLGVPLQTMFLDDRDQTSRRPDRATDLSEEGETEYLSCATSNLATLPAPRESETENGQASVPVQEIRSPHVQHSLAPSQLPVDEVQPPTLIFSEEAERSGMLCAAPAQDLQHGMQLSITTQDALLERTDLSGMPMTRSTTVLQSVEPSRDPHAEQAGLRPEVRPLSPMQDEPAEAEGAGTSGTIAAQNLQPETQSSTALQHNPPERTRPNERMQIGLQPSSTLGLEQPTQLFTVPPAAVNSLSHSSEPLIFECERLKLFKAALTKDFEQKTSKIQAERNQEIEKIMKKYELLHQKQEQAYHHWHKFIDDMYMKVFLQQSLGENFRERFMKSAQERSVSPTIWQAPQSSQQALSRMSVAQATSLPVASPLATRSPGLNTLHSAGPFLQPSQVARPSAPDAVQPQSHYRAIPSPVSSMPLRNGSYGRAPAPHLQHPRMPAASVMVCRDQRQLAAMMSPGITSSTRQSAPGVPLSFASASALPGVPFIPMASSSVQQAMPSPSSSLPALPGSLLLPGSGPELMTSYVQSPSTIPVAMALTPGFPPEPTRESQALQFQRQWPHAMTPPSLVQQTVASSSNPHPGLAAFSTNHYLMAAQQALVPNPGLDNMAGTLNTAAGVWRHGGAPPAAVASQPAPVPALLNVQQAGRTGLQTSGGPAGAAAQGGAAEVVCLSDDEE